MLLSIFTPTYNRAYSLRRVYDSLLAQTDDRFEWLIVDDGSFDETDLLINSFINEPHPFEIRYYKQEHKGKPSAQNKAIDLARGDFFITCDSNKCFDKRGVENILAMAESIAESPKICGVGGYRADFSGNIYGGEMSLNGKDYIDCSQLEREKYHLSGDKSTAFRTEILKRYKSPIFEGESFITEAVWLIQMALDGYVIRWFPEIICYGEYEKNGLTAMGANSYIGHYQNFLGFLEYIRVYIQAYGVEQAKELIFEAMDIAKKKNMPLQMMASKIECDPKRIMKLAFKRRAAGVYYKLPVSGPGLRRILGDSRADKIKHLLGRDKQ